MSTPAQVLAPPLDEIEHPWLGKLAFPKDMPPEQRNQIISDMEAKQPEPMLHKVNEGLSNLGIGALKGAGHTLGEIGNLIPLPGVPKANLNQPAVTPEGTMQKLGYGGEQVGEFMLPMGAEKKGAELLAAHAPQWAAKVAPPLARIGTQALSAGTVNALHGEPFKQGAVAGALGGAAGEAGKAVAPSLVRSALRLGSKRESAEPFAEAVLNETTGVKPSTIARQGGEKINQLYEELLGKARTRGEELTIPPPTQPPTRGLLGAAPEVVPLGEPPAPIDVPGQLLPAREMRRANIVGGMGEQVAHELGEPTAGTIPSRLQRQGFLTSSPEWWEQGAEGARAVEKNPVPRGPSGPGIMETRDPFVINQFRETTPGPYNIPAPQPTLSAEAPSVKPALDVLDKHIQHARAQNSPFVQTLGDLRTALTHDVATGAPLPVRTTPEDILLRKQGFGQRITNWERVNGPLPEGVKREVYHALDSELDRTVPGSEQLNERMHNLFQPSKNAAIIANAPDITQRSLERIARPTGGMVLPMALGAGGARSAGLPGALLGGGLGLLGMEAISSPAGKMAAARLAQSGVPTHLLPAVTLELLRKEEQAKQP